MASVFERGTDGPKVIVAAVDGSVTSMRAAAYAAGLARRQSAELVVVYVAGGSVMSTFVPAAASAVGEAEHDVAAELREKVEAGTSAAGIRARFIELRGDPFHEISKVCTKVIADAVVVGASTSQGHRLVGSIGIRLVRAGLWPVTVVP